MMTREKAREWFLDHMPCKAIMPMAYSAYQNAVAALQGPTREQVERMRGEWIAVTERELTGFNPELAGCDPIGGYECSRCKAEAVLDCNDEFVLDNFCPACGAPMTDKAVDMMLEKWKEALREKPL